MGKFGGIELSETKLCGYTNYSGTITVGYTRVEAINYTSTGLNTNLTEATDIDNPTSWTDLVDISSNDILVSMSNDYAISVEVYSGEDVDDALRIQILKDSSIIWDGKAVRNASGDSECFCTSVSNNPSYVPCPISIQPIFCSSFKIRAVRHGSFTSSYSALRVPAICYTDVERI